MPRVGAAAAARPAAHAGRAAAAPSALPIAQCAVAAGRAPGSWRPTCVGHARPFFAPIAAVISLGVSLGSRLRRVVELVVGVSLGVLVGDLLISQIGSGTWQIMLVVALAMAAAVFADGATLLVAQAGVVGGAGGHPAPAGRRGRHRPLRRRADRRRGRACSWPRVLPSDPVGPVRREARALLDELAAVLARHRRRAARPGRRGRGRPRCAGPGPASR